jgi:SLT domain-containing protein
MWLIIVLIVAGFGGAGGVAVAASTLGAPPAGQPAPPAQVQTWIAQANQILLAHGTPAGDLDPADQWLIIRHESGGNPLAENRSDSNFVAGHPSKGIMQTIDSTFRANALPGHEDIWMPVDNIIAGSLYAIRRYGSIRNVPGVVAVHEGRPYVGY